MVERAEMSRNYLKQSKTTKNSHNINAKQQIIMIKDTETTNKNPPVPIFRQNIYEKLYNTVHLSSIKYFRFFSEIA